MILKKITLPKAMINIFRGYGVENPLSLAALDSSPKGRAKKGSFKFKMFKFQFIDCVTIPGEMSCVSISRYVGA